MQVVSFPLDRNAVMALARSWRDEFMPMHPEAMKAFKAFVKSGANPDMLLLRSYRMWLEAVTDALERAMRERE